MVPTYFWRLPQIVAEYLEKIRIERIADIHFSLLAMGQQQVRLAVWRLVPTGHKVGTATTVSGEMVCYLSIGQ
mgnify:CR=1 FL=1